MSVVTADRYLYAGVTEQLFYHTSEDPSIQVILPATQLRLVWLFFLISYSPSCQVGVQDEERRQLLLGTKQ